MINGKLDIIGLDVFAIRTSDLNGKTPDEFVAEKTVQDSKFIEVGDTTFFVRSTVADVNSVITVLPDDLDPNVAIQVQLEISNILSKYEIKIGEERLQQVADELEAESLEVVGDEPSVES